jgi:hydrogenase expression/formation protein HypE
MSIVQQHIQQQIPHAPRTAAPAEIPEELCIELDHGTGGALSQELIGGLIAPRLGAVHEGKMEDSAVLTITADRIAMTTDSFVVDPIFFGNGDIGKLAVCGTVIDLAVAGATPRFLTFALVLEEGFPIRGLEHILDSVRKAAEEATVAIVAGDTKVVGAGEVDRIFINTAGVGEITRQDVTLGLAHVKTGDAIIVTSQLGNHSIHILSLREGLGFDQRIGSDCAPLNGLVDTILDADTPAIHCMRDITRGGLGTVLNEMADGADVSIWIDEERLPILHETAMAADMLGVNPMYLANEGNLCLFVDGAKAEAILDLIQKHEYGPNAEIIGVVGERSDPPVTLRHADGTQSTVELLRGAELPRLC